MRNTFFTIILLINSIFLSGYSIQSPAGSDVDVAAIQWQYFYLDEQNTYRLEGNGQAVGNDLTTLLDTTSNFIDGPAVLSLSGRFPDDGLTLILDANPTVGAVWESINDLSTSGLSVNTIDFASYSDLIGSQGKLTILVKTTSSVNQHLELSYHRPWLSDQLPLHKLTLSSGIIPTRIDLSHPVTPKLKTMPDSSMRSDPDTERLSPATLPMDFDWRNVSGVNYVTPVKDQGFTGSCWAYTITGAMESSLLINSDGFNASTLDLSEQYLISCNRDGYSSAGNSNATAYYLDKTGQLYNPPGAVLESVFPESPYKNNYPSTHLGCSLSTLKHPYRLSSWNYVYSGIDPDTWRPYDPDLNLFRQNRDLIKSAILTHGPVGAGIWANFNFGSYTGGIYIEPSGTSTPNHAVLIIGWHDTGNPATSYWIIKNSSGTGWGYAGFGYVGFTSEVIGYGAYYLDALPYSSGIKDHQVYLPLVNLNASNTAGHWVEVFSDDFERDELGTGWEANDGGNYAYDPSTYSPYFWGISECRATTPGGHSLWVLGDGATAPPACGSAYDNYGKLSARALYGPIDLSGATSAYMKFKIWLNTQPYGVLQLIYAGDPGSYDDIYDYGYDSFRYSATEKNTDYLVFPRYPGYVMGNTSGWKEMILNLADIDGSQRDDWDNVLLNYSHVYIYFEFASDSKEIGTYPEGIYLDDILIKKCIGGTCQFNW
jgi:C1A family cysteine protease